MLTGPPSTSAVGQRPVRSSAPTFRSIVAAARRRRPTTVQSRPVTGIAGRVARRSNPCSCGGNENRRTTDRLTCADDVAAASGRRARPARRSARRRLSVRSVEVPPPGRLGLAPVPVQQVGQQRLGLLLRGPLGRVGRAARPAAPPGCRATSGSSAVAFLVRHHGRGRSGRPSSRGQLGPPLPPASPAAPAWPGSRPRCSRATTCWPVSASAVRRAVPSSSAASNAIRCSVASAQRHLPRVPAQRLEPLDRVALDPGPQPCRTTRYRSTNTPSRNRSSTSSSRVANRPISRPTASWRVSCSSVRWSTDVGS